MPFCENCGTELSAEMKFCAACGTPVAEAPAAPVAAPVAEPAPAPAAAPVQEPAPAAAPVEAAPAPVAVAEAPVAPVYEAPVAEQPKPKKKKGKLIALITAGVALVAAAAVAVVMFVLPMFGKVEYTPYALYVKDGNLVIAGLETDDITPLELTEGVVVTNGEVQWDNLKSTLANRVRVVGDNVFYAEPNEESKVSLLLYYRPLNDTEEDPFEIDNNVGNFAVTEDGDTVYYLTVDEEPANANDSTVGTLYRYEVGADEAEEIVDDVRGFYISADGENIFYGDNELRYHVMYGDDEIDLPKDAEMVAFSEDFTVLLYNDDDELVRMEKGEEEELCDSVGSIYAANEELTSFFYYVDGETVSHKLSEFLVNDMETMQRPTEPVEPVAPEYPSSSDYRDADGWIDYDAYNAAVDEYNAAYDEYRSKRDEYYNALDEYHNKMDTFENAEDLLSDAAEETYEIRSRELYYFDGSEAKKVASGNEISREAELGEQAAMVYTVTAAPTAKPQIKLSEVESVWDLHDAVEEAYEGEKKTYIVVEGTASELNDVVSSAAFTEEGLLYYTVVDKKDGTEGGAATQTLYSRKLSGSSLGTVTVEDQGVEGSFSVVGEDVVYYKELETDEKTYASYGNMYVSGTMVAAKAKQWSWKYDEEGGIATLGEVDNVYGFGTLYVCKDGNVKKVRGDVSDFQWTLSGDLVYLDRLGTENTGTLYVYNADRSDSTVIDGDVQALVPQYAGNTLR